MKGLEMAKFRLTTGEDGTAFGKQYVVIAEEAENALEFARACLHYAIVGLINEDDARAFLNNCWIDAGADTIPIAVMNLKLD